MVGSQAQGLGDERQQYRNTACFVKFHTGSAEAGDQTRVYMSK